MQSITHRGITGKTIFHAPFLNAVTADLSVTVAGVTAPFTFALQRVTLNTALVADADVVITDNRLAFATAAKTSTANAAAQVAPANAGRTYAKVFNDGATVKRFAVGANASATVGIPVASGTGYEWPVPPKEAISVFCTAAESYQYEGD